MEAITYIDGTWHEGNPPIMGPLTHAAWLASAVFDGARSFNRLAPDLDLHCRRINRSAAAMGLKATVDADEMVALCWQGIERFPEEAVLYIRPMYFAEKGFVVPDPETTRFVLTMYLAPFPTAPSFSARLSSRRRPNPDSAPTDAKASCLYPNAARALREAAAGGFDNAVVLDQIGNVAEFATANLFMAKDGAAVTPIPNGTFLNGVTRQRIIDLLREDGVEVVERTLPLDELREADEIFSTGNFAKVWPVNRFEDRHLQPGPIGQRAKNLYFAYAERNGRR